MFSQGLHRREARPVLHRQSAPARSHASRARVPAIHLPAVSPLLQIHTDLLLVCANIYRAIRTDPRRMARRASSSTMPSVEPRGLRPGSISPDRESF